MKYLVIFTSLILIFCVFCSFLPSENDRVIYNSPIRLHVLANSDSAHDQEIKLAVRDAVLDEVRALLANADTTEEALSLLEKHLWQIRNRCDEVLKANGEALSATVMLSEERYPTRHYETISLPAGTYRSLRVMIGSAEGKNWWCILFPALCTSVAKTESSLVKTGFSPEQIETLTNGESPKYKIKFKFLEIFGENFS